MQLGRIVLALSLVALPVTGACGSSPKKVKKERKSKREKSRKSRPRSTPKGRDNADSAYRKAIDAEADGDLRAASKYYQQAIELDSAHPRANQRYVHFLIDHGKKAKAKRVARRFFDELPGKAISYHTLADAHAALGEHRKVVGVMSGLLAFDEEDATAFEIRGRARLKMGDNEEGIDDIRRALEMEPKNPDFLTSLAGGLIFRMNQGEEARKVLARALRSDKRNSRAHLLLGLLSRKEGKQKESLKHLQRAVAVDSESARAHFELGVAQNILGNDSAAEKRFGRAIDLDPKNGIYWYTYGDLQRLLGQNEGAAAAFRKSVEFAPENPKAWQRLGETLMATDQVKDAVRQLRRGIGKVDAPGLYYLLAKAYQRQKKKDRAIEALENYLDAAADNAPNRRAASKLLRRLRR